ncbi:MAG: hypothetical protein JNK48_12475 [Bryobacterales bacterium]|nr:hypothetical protein [Bryobacterales bacterium]
MMLLPILAFVMALAAQTPPYDPNDPEGIQIWPNKMGRYPWKRPGVFKVQKLYAPTGNAWRAPALTTAELQQMTATLDKLSALIKATPTASSGLIGYWIKESRTFYYPAAPDLPAGTPLATSPFFYSSGFYAFVLEDVLTNGRFVPQWGGETTPAYFEFNRLPGHLRQPVPLKEPAPGDALETEFYTRPQQTGQYAGFPVYDGTKLVIARSGRDLWTSVSYGRALKAALPLLAKDAATAESRLASLKKQNEDVQSPAYEQKMREHLEKYSGSFKSSNPTKWQGRVAGMERELKYNREQAALKANPQRDKDGDWYWNPIDARAEAAKRLAALQPQDAARPACYLLAAAKNGRYALPGDVLPLGSNPQCRELVTTNFQYFDARLPRSVPQILVLPDLDRCADVVNGKLINKDRPRPDRPPQGCLKNVPIWEELDWKAAAALVVP